jgi:hypothetical protein
MSVPGLAVETLLAVISTTPPHFAVSCAMICPSSLLLAELVCTAIGDGSLDAGDGFTDQALERSPC